uniref:Ubiquitin carboxyl-terminal hydrolase 10 isoform x1 n=1 Tax=Triatoma infestans TaxID=30076 RepID=A0A170XY09_TRIIF
MSNKNKSGLKSRQYKLFAVVYHDGKEATKGHYLSDVFHVGTSGWIRYDDAVVRSVPESQVLNPPFPRVPYLLYYRRQDTIGQQSGQQQHHLNTQQTMAGQVSAANNQHHQR